MKHIVIIGGGAAGLGAAYKIKRAADEGHDVSFTLVEKDDRLGGKIATTTVKDEWGGDGESFIVDGGPDCFLSSKPAVHRIAKLMGTLEDELPTEYTVARDGTVDIPYIHRISVAGLQPQEISDVIRGKLIGGQILTDPSVIVSIKAYNSKRITVGGEVKEDGSFPFEPGMTVADAIVQAGGMTSLSKSWSVILLRKTKDGKKRVVVDYDAITNNEIPDVPLQAGDKITVPQRAF